MHDSLGSLELAWWLLFQATLVKSPMQMDTVGNTMVPLTSLSCPLGAKSALVLCVVCPFVSCGSIVGSN